jgi:hypothetical protein
MLRADRMDELGSTAIGRDGLRVIDRDRRHGCGRGRRPTLRSAHVPRSLWFADQRKADTIV